MPFSPLPDELRDFLAKPNPSVIATLRPDGQPGHACDWWAARTARTTSLASPCLST